MQTTIAFVLLFSLRTVSLAADVTVYKYDYLYDGQQNLKPVAVSRFPYMFSFHSGGIRHPINIWLKNISPSVSAINITCNTDAGTFEVLSVVIRVGPRKGEKHYSISQLKFLLITEMQIMLMLYTSNVLCSSLVVAKGKATSKMYYPYLDPFYLNYGGVLVVVNLKNKCDGPPTKMNRITENAVTDVETIHSDNTFTSNSSTNLEITTHKNSANDTKNVGQQPSQNVIPSVIGMCVIILVIYLVWITKICHRNSSPVRTIELDTSHHEPFYLNMLFRRECDREIAELEQIHYEEINEHVYDEVAPQVTEDG